MWPYRAALIPVTLHADGFKTLWPANPFSINKTTGLAGGEGDKENLLSVFFWVGSWLGVFLSGCWRWHLRWHSCPWAERGGKGRLEEAGLRKTKQGVCLRSRKHGRQFISHRTSICALQVPLSVSLTHSPSLSLPLCRPAQPQRAATSHWCSTMCGGVGALQGECVFVCVCVSWFWWNIQRPLWLFKTKQPLYTNHFIPGHFRKLVFYMIWFNPAPDPSRNQVW